VTGRALVLVGAAGVGVLVWLAYALGRKRWGRDIERLEIDELGLELMAGCCAFVVFTTPACRPCKAALRVVADAASESPGSTEVATIDAIDRADLAVRYDVRTIPTVFLITASGHVVKRWRDVPNPDDARLSLAAV
jgi:glutaredoxin